MVLEDASAPTSINETFRDDSSPSSDFDPYSGSSSSSTNLEDVDMGARKPETFPSGYRIPLDQLPGPAPFFGPLLGFTRSNQALLIEATAATFAKAAKRPLTEEEVNAISWHTSKAFVVSSYGHPVGVGAAMTRWWTTRHTMRFPFYQPDLDKYKFQSLGPLKGNTAFRAYQSIRLFCYGFFGSWVGKMLFSTYGVTIMFTGQQLDSRLKGLYDEIRKMGPQNKGNLGGRNATQAPRQEDEASASDGAYGVASQTAMAPSPSAGGTGSTAAEYSDPQLRPGSWQNKDDYSGRSFGSAEPAYNPERPASRSSSPSFDDASPTAGNQPVDQDSGYGSVWERLRKGGGQGSQGSQPSQSTATPRRSTQEGDAWARMRGSESTGQANQYDGAASEETMDDDKRW